MRKDPVTVHFKAPMNTWRSYLKLRISGPTPRDSNREFWTTLWPTLNDCESNPKGNMLAGTRAPDSFGEGSQHTQQYSEMFCKGLLKTFSHYISGRVRAPTWIALL